jgi:hypothetical protein
VVASRRTASDSRAGRKGMLQAHGNRTPVPWFDPADQDGKIDCLLARISHPITGAGLAIAAPTGFRALQTHPVFAATRKPGDMTIPCAIIPQSDEECGLAEKCASNAAKASSVATQVRHLVLLGVVDRVSGGGAVRFRRPDIP